MMFFLINEVKHQNMKNKQCFGVRASDKTPLCFLKPGDVLYIFAHGNTSVIGNRISEWANIESWDVSNSINTTTFTKKF